MNLRSPPQETGLQCTWFLGLLLKSDFCTVNVIKKQGKEGENKFFEISKFQDWSTCFKVQ